MLVSVIQFMKKKKWALPTPVSPLVWLKCLNACLKAPRNVLKEIQALSLVVRDNVSTYITSYCATDKKYRERSFIVGFGMRQSARSFFGLLRFI